MRFKNIVGIFLFLGLAIGCADRNHETFQTQQSGAGIVNGQNAAQDDTLAHSVVGIYLNESRGTRPLTQLCTGTLIRRNVILTAAHCVEDAIAKEPANYIVSFGLKVVRSKSDLQHVVLREVIDKKVHPNWIHPSPIVPSMPLYDAGLLFLKEEAPSDFQTIDFAQPEDQLTRNQFILAYGYGLLDGIDHVEADSLFQAKMKISNPEFSETHFEASDLSSVCSGDSGGPAFSIEDKAHPIVVGITSFGPGDCRRLSYFTRVSIFSQWISDSIQSAVVK